MDSPRLLAPLLSQSDVSQPVVILGIALALAGVAILVLFAKDKI
jgi:hypothetical protein